MPPDQTAPSSSPPVDPILPADPTTGVSSGTVFEPAGGVHKHGNWDDVVQNAQKAVVPSAKSPIVSDTSPSDIWEEKGISAPKVQEEPILPPIVPDHSAEPEPVEHPKIQLHKDSVPAELPPDADSTESEPIVEPIVPETPTAPPVPAEAVETPEAANEQPVQPATTTQTETPPSDETITPAPQFTEVDTDHEAALQRSLSDRMVDFGKAAVTNIVLPLVTPGKITANMLLGRKQREPVAPAIPQPQASQSAPSAKEHSIQFVSPMASAAPVSQTQASNLNIGRWVVKDDSERAVDIVAATLNISPQEAMKRLHTAVEKANQHAATAALQPGQKYTGRPDPVAEVIDHDPRTQDDDEIGVYIEVNGGKVLSMNPHDVLRLLDEFIT